MVISQSRGNFFKTQEEGGEIGESGRELLNPGYFCKSKMEKGL
jgi:hypothetical protein